MIDLAVESNFQVGGVAVKPAVRLFGDEQVEPRVMQVLVALARRPGDVVSRDDLVEQCWDGRIVSEDAIQRPIGRLRKLGEDSGAFEIETITKVGYRLLNPEKAAAKGLAPATMAAATPDVVLAVLAFDNLSAEPDMGFFADGVSDEILLTVSRAIWTIGRASSFQFRGAGKAVRKVAAELGATHIVDGSVRCSGDRVRVSAQLIEASTQLTLWQSQYERPARDLFAVQDEIATAVASALNCRLKIPSVGGPIDAESHEKYVRAREVRCSFSATDEAISLLTEALQRAPNFAPAWVELAFTQTSKLRQGVRPEERQALFDQARFAADRAIALSDGDDVARQFEARFMPVCGAWTEQEAIHRHLLTKYPHDILLLTPLSFLLLETGRLTDTLPLTRQIYEREPLHAGTARNYALVLGALGRHDEEIAIYESACRRWPEVASIWSLLVTSAAQLGRWDIVERNTKQEQLARFPVNAPLVRGALRSVATYRESGPQRAERVLSRLVEALERTGRLRLSAIAATAEFADLDMLFALADRAPFSHLFDIGNSDPTDGGAQSLFLAFAKRLRSDPRFVTLCARLGMVTHWIEMDRWPDCANEVRYDFRAEARRLHEQRLDMREKEKAA